MNLIAIEFSSPGPGVATLYVTARLTLRALRAKFLKIFRGPSYGYPHYFPAQHIRQFSSRVMYAWTAPPTRSAAHELLDCGREGLGRNLKTEA